MKRLLMVAGSVVAVALLAGVAVAQMERGQNQIGRASCRERV